jgi:hypothetical protein
MNIKKKGGTCKLNTGIPIYIFKFGGYGHLWILFVWVRRMHMKVIWQIKLGSSSKDLARVSEEPVSNLSCDVDYPYRDSPCFYKVSRGQ